MMKNLQKWNHLALLVTIIVLSVLQTLFVRWSTSTRALGDVVAILLFFGVLLVIFTQQWQRRWALILVSPALGANCAHYLVSGPLQVVCIIVYHCSATAFLGFAVAVILSDIFKRKIIQPDDIIGVACGYVLVALVWGNLYALVYAFFPGAFRVAQEITWQLDSWHLQRALFNYFSCVTLATMGYSAITPTGTPAQSLVWIEAIFGQLYLAIVVAQIVALMVRPGDETGVS